MRVPLTAMLLLLLASAVGCQAPTRSITLQQPKAVTPVPAVAVYEVRFVDSNPAASVAARRPLIREAAIHALQQEIADTEFNVVEHFVSHSSVPSRDHLAFSVSDGWLEAGEQRMADLRRARDSGTRAAIRASVQIDDGGPEPTIIETKISAVMDDD
ncbi:MAG: hypothetical protein JJU36_05930 [Phycisphaeraceae bacterium]|nr:hypothetical protein [Phycisphaeraceae bacterium]